MSTITISCIRDYKSLAYLHMKLIVKLRKKQNIKYDQPIAFQYWQWDMLITNVTLIYLLLIHLLKDYQNNRSNKLRLLILSVYFYNHKVKLFWFVEQRECRIYKQMKNLFRLSRILLTRFISITLRGIIMKL